MNCQSCGMPMDKSEDHGGSDVNNPFCKYCTDERGNLMPREQVRAKMIEFYIQKQGKTQEEAEKLTDQLMGTMPAWKGEGVAAPSEPQPEASRPLDETTPPVEGPKPEETTEPPPGSAPGPTETPEPTPEPTTPETSPAASPPSEETTPPAQPTETPAETTKPEGETPTE